MGATASFTAPHPMPQSLAKIYLHIIFSTKNRNPTLSSNTRQPLYNYMAGILKNHRAEAYEINGTSDHVHVLCLLPRTIAVADLLRHLKSDSTKWYQSENQQPTFAWQSGYGAFSVSQSEVGKVRNYIQNQEEHHRHHTFQEEYRLFLKRYNVEYDEKYVWD